LTTKRKKGSSYTPPAGDRYWWKRNQSSTGKPGGPSRTKDNRDGDPARTKDRRDGDSAPRSASGGDRRPQARGARKGDSPETIAGRNSVVEALRAGIPANVLYVARGETDPRTREAMQLAADHGIRVLEAGRTELDRMTDHAVHQGIALQVPEYQYPHTNDLLGRATNGDRPALIVALDGITDPRNLGAVARSAAAFGAHGMLVPERRAAGVTAGAWKTSAGALTRVPVARATNLTRALEEYKKAGLFVIGLDAGAEQTVADVDLASGPVVLVVGSEDKGLSRLVTQTCDAVVRIPMSATTESLNAGVAAGIALYEIARHRA
jgi:23S rRNA (guanosine2251-2'-O)-methyltransferase